MCICSTWVITFTNGKVDGWRVDVRLKERHVKIIKDRNDQGPRLAWYLFPRGIKKCWWKCLMAFWQFSSVRSWKTIFFGWSFTHSSQLEQRQNHGRNNDMHVRKAKLDYKKDPCFATIAGAFYAASYLCGLGKENVCTKVWRAPLPVTIFII